MPDPNGDESRDDEPVRRASFGVSLVCGFNEIYNSGKGGIDLAHEISPVAIDWIKRNGRADNWFLHVNLWDPHTPYRTPAEFGDPFKDDPLPAWLTEEVRQQHWNGCGPHSAREVHGFGPGEYDETVKRLYPRQPSVIDSMAQVRRMFDGYDTGVRYADEHIGRIVNAVADANGARRNRDHRHRGSRRKPRRAETSTATTRPPTTAPRACRCRQLARRDDVAARRYGFALRDRLRRHDDCAAGRESPQNWDGAAFDLKSASAGREYLVLSQGAWSCQRAVRFGDFVCIRSYHDGYHAFPDVMLFDLKKDPHEQNDIARCTRMSSVARSRIWKVGMGRRCDRPPADSIPCGR
jgi:hypothetical protein